MGIFVAMTKARRPPSATAARAEMALRLRRIREIVEANQAEVARAVDVTAATWNNYELGKRDIDPLVLAKFCRRYDVSSDWIVLGDISALSSPYLAAMVSAHPDILRQQPPDDAIEETPGRSGEPEAPTRQRARIRA